MKQFINSILNKYIRNNNETDNTTYDSEYIREIKKVTNEKRDEKLEETINDIKTFIGDASKKGRNRIEYSLLYPYTNEWLLEEVRDYFSKLGFYVKFDEISECIIIIW